MKSNRNVVLYQIIQRVRAVYNSAVKDAAYLDLSSYFPEHAILEKNWQLIRDEIKKVVDQSELPKFHEIDKGQEFISKNDGKTWNIYALKMYGMWSNHNLKRCPKTYELLRDMKNVKSINFSILAPGKHIPPHEGPYKGIIRYQLALEVPKEGDCFIVVNGEKYYWKEGESVLFDDTYTHEVLNNTNERRIALLLDIKRENIKFPMKVFDWFYYRLIQTAIVLGGGMRKSRVG